MFEIRKLNETNMEEFSGLVLGMARESVYRHYDLDLERTLYVIMTMADDPSAYTRALYINGQMVGFMVGEVQRNPWFNCQMAVDHAFYVMPRFRKTRGLVSGLLKDFEEWARSKGAQRIQLTAAAQDDNTKTSRFLALKGFAQYGFVHSKEL